MTSSSFGRDGDIEAFVVDRYLESLLARTAIDTTGVPESLEATAQRLAATLPRYHPSFRFEEALSARLATLARGPGSGDVIAWPLAGADRPFVGLDDRVPGLARPVVIGGVLTSAALSLAGAAFVAWRRAHAGDPMVRAIRSVVRTRVA